MHRRSTTATGTASEELAVRHLADKGYTIVKRNFRFGREGEIDIVALDGEVLVFVEVKARASHVYGSPESAVTVAKQRTIRHAAHGYCYINGVEGRECRFDVVAIDLSETPPAVRHLVGAF